MNTYKRLLVEYITGDSQIVQMEGIYELDELLDSYLSILNPDQWFSIDATRWCLRFVEQRISEENRHYFFLDFDEWRYIEQLELMLRSLVL